MKESKRREMRLGRKDGRKEGTAVQGYESYHLNSGFEHKTEG